MDFKKLDFKANVLPHIIAIAIFYVLTMVYYSPIFMQNKDLPQGDVTSYVGWGDDVRQHYKETGERAFWSNAMFSGMPSNYAFPQETNNVFKYAIDLVKGFLPSNTAGAFFIFLLGFYIFMLAIDCSSWLSIIGAIAYAFSSYNLIIVEAGHVSKVEVMATMAPIIGGVIMTYRGKVLMGTLITLIFTGLNVLFNHQQISYYLLIILVVLAIVYFIYAIKEKTIAKFFKHSGILLLVGMLAAAPAVDKLLPTLDFSKETMRGGSVLRGKADEKGNKPEATSGLDIDYAFQWSYGKMETFTLLIPNLYGASSAYNIGEDSNTYEALRPTGQAKQISQNAPMYWGNQPFTSGPVYIGAIICLLFVLGLITYKGPEKWWILVVTIISIMMSWGKNFMPFNEFLFNYLPLYNKFRVPAMSLIITQLSMAALAMLTIKQFLEEDDKAKFMKPLMIAGSIVCGLCLLFAFVVPSIASFSGTSDANLPDWLIDAVKDDRKAMMRADALRSFVFIALSLGVLYVYLRGMLKSASAVLAAVGLLILVDLWAVDKRFLNEDSFISNRKAKKIEATAIDQQIMQDKSLGYRVLNLTTSTFNESKTSYFHKSVGGYSPAKLRRYQDIIDQNFSGDINQNVLDMLNTKYIITNSQQGPRVQRNYGAKGNAWFVQNINWCEDADNEILVLKAEDLAINALMEISQREHYKNGYLNADPSARIKLDRYDGPGRMFYKYTASSPQTVVFSEVYYKTWKAYVDEVEVPILRANYLLRAIQVPEGEHEIKFECIDEVYLTAHTWSLVFSILVVLTILGLIGGMVYKNNKQQKD